MCINAVDEVALPETYQQRYSLPLPSYYDYRDEDDQKYIIQPVYHDHQHEYKVYHHHHHCRTREANKCLLVP